MLLHNHSEVLPCSDHVALHATTCLQQTDNWYLNNSILCKFSDTNIGTVAQGALNLVRP